MKRAWLVCSLVCISFYCAQAQQKLTAEQVLQRHTDSVGSSATLANAKSRVVEGTAFYRILTNGTGEFPGKAVMASSDNKFHTLLKTDAQGYHGERFISDGDGKTSVATTYANFTRSHFGDFLQRENVPLQDGLLGGVLTTAWPLIAANFPKETFQYEGLKKVDGVELHVVGYKPKRKTGLKITLFFEPQTFRHVLTTYVEQEDAGLARGAIDPNLTPAQGKGASGIANGMAQTANSLSGPDVRTARLRPTTWMIEERFGNFTTLDGLTLPFHYDLRYQEQLQNNITNTIDWEVRVTGVHNNIPVDAKNFEIR
jgi:hypothetical protein